MGPIRKHTIDRRRRAKGTVLAPPKPAPTANETDSNEEDSSVDVASPTKARMKQRSSETDSSADEVTPKKKAPAKATVSKRRHQDSDEQVDSDSSEAQESNEEEEKEEQSPTRARKKTLARSKATPKKKKLKTKKQQAPRGRRKKAPSDDEEEEGVSESSAEESNVSEFDPDGENEQQSEDSEESWDDEEAVKPKRGRPKNAAKGKRQTKRTPGRGRTASTRRRRRRNQSDSEESWNSDMEYTTPRTGTRQSRRAAAARTPESSSEEDDDDDSPRRSTPSRRSANRALKRISDNVAKDARPEDEDDDEPADLFGSARRNRKKKRSDDDDDEFDPDAEEEDEDDDVDEDDLDDESVTEDRDLKQYEAGNVDAQQDFLTADSSDDENATGPSPMLDVKTRPASRSLRAAAKSAKQDSDSFASSDSDEDAEPEQKMPGFSSSPHMPDCPTEVDAITMDPLPEKHICYFPPDQQSRQCFALETLHKIALSSSVRGPDGKPTFLQPPHFRSVASDDFIDQIASRFGRSALDLKGDFYNRGVLGGGDDDYQLTIGANLADEETFQERLNEYISNCMGSQDIYCCPLCYIEAHRRLVNRLSGEGEDSGEEEDGDPDEPAEDENAPIKLWHDPMTVLGFPDNEKYAIASTFCFHKMADVKRHLRESHNVDTKALSNNDLFARFKVRTGDGLLQRYIDKIKGGRRTSYQGDMRRYWNMGNNQTFVFLLYLMKRRVILKEMLDSSEDVRGEASTLFDDAQDFYQSFQNRAVRTWEAVSAPYRKATKEELNEFIEEGDVEEEEDVKPHFAMQRELNMNNPEDEIVEALQQRRRRMSHGCDEEDSEDSSVEVVEVPSRKQNDSSEDDGANPSNMPGYYSEEEEDDDEWVTSKLARPGRRGSKVSSPEETTAPRPGKRLRKKKRDGQPKRDDAEDNSTPPAMKKLKRKRVIIHSDSDE